MAENWREGIEREIKSLPVEAQNPVRNWLDAVMRLEAAIEGTKAAKIPLTTQGRVRAFRESMQAALQYADATEIYLGMLAGLQGKDEQQGG